VAANGVRRILTGVLCLVLLAGLMPPAYAQSISVVFRVMHDRWSDADERDYSDFISALGSADCSSIDRCLKSTANPFARTDPPDIYFRTDCADLPYVLRAYFAWKRGLPFSFIASVSPRGNTNDIRYTTAGNEIALRQDVLSGSTEGPALLRRLTDEVSSAQYRLHPDMEGTDYYPVRLDRKAMKPGTVLYDPNGHVAMIYKIEDDGRIFFMDAHPDNSLTRGTYGKKFVRSSPGMGAGFKNWRPIRLVGAVTTPDGTLTGGHVEFARNADLPDYSTEQYFGNGTRPADREWASGSFMLQEQPVDYYDYVRAKMAGGSLSFEPIQEVRNMVRANCEDIRYRAEAIDLSIRAGIQNRPQPERLPGNIFGTEGDWEEYSTPSRDARLKTSFKELRDQVQRFVEWKNVGDGRIHYVGNNLPASLLAAYDDEASKCTITYLRSNGTPVQLGYEDVRRRMFDLSFDPYHCVERRWGATQPSELATCSDDATKAAWYGAEKFLRNQLDRTYDARMDFGLAELRTGPGPGKGVVLPPDIDVRTYLLRFLAAPAPSASMMPKAAPASGSDLRSRTH
jgi:hypothetical protein